MSDKTVSAATLELIRDLQSDIPLKDFVLVGGTALSLQLGHRISVDIDFFTRNQFHNQELLEFLEKKYGFQMQYMHSNTLKGIINGVFVDFLTHDYSMVAEPLIKDGIILASLEDIAAMKVNAITGNGTRVKDFIDIYFLLKRYSFSQIIEFYKIKYTTRNDFHAIKSLTWFEDVIIEEWPNMLLEKGLTFSKLKREIIHRRDMFLDKEKSDFAS